MSQLVLNRQVVLRRILRTHMRLKLSKQQNRTECRPVDGLPPHWVQDSIERIGIDRCSILPKKRQVELSIDRESTAAKWWLCAELLQYELLNRVVEQAPSCANARFARCTRTPSDADARSESLVISLSKASWHPLVAWNQQTGGEHGCAIARA